MNGMRARTARLPATRETGIVLLLIVAHFVFAAVWSVVVPLGEAPDEADHWAYITFLARERRLPRGPELTQSKHPPLYHATAALWASLATPDVGRVDSRLFLRANPDVSFSPADVAAGTHSYNSFIHTTYEDWPWRPGPRAYHVARLWSVLLSTLTLWATYGLLRLALPEHSKVAVAGVALLTFLPEFTFIGAVLNNDSAAAFLGTAALWGGMSIYRHQGRARAGWWTPLALGFGVWAKVSTVALWPAVGVLVLASAWNRSRRGCARALALVFLPALLIAAPWFLRNWFLYGDPLGWELVRQTVDLRQGPWTWADTRWLLRGWFLSFWGKFGSAGHIPLAPTVYLLLAGASVLALAGVARAVPRIWRQGNGIPLGALALAVAGIVLAMWRYSLVALGTDQARLLFPAIGPLAGFLALGWLAWFPPRRQALAALAVATATLALGLYALLGVVMPAYAPPPTAPVEEWARGPRTVPVRFGPIALVAWDLQETPTFYWQALEPPGDDIRVVLRITAVDGTLVWEWKRSPGAGRWSTDHWPRGYVMRDRYRVSWPDWAGPGRYRVEVAAYTFSGETLIPTRGGIPVATEEHPYVMVGWLRR